MVDCAPLPKSFKKNGITMKNITQELQKYSDDKLTQAQRREEIRLNSIGKMDAVLNFFFKIQKCVSK